MSEPRREAGEWIYTRRDGGHVVLVALMRTQRFLLEFLNSENPSKVDAVATLEIVRAALAAAKGDA
jgi:hypothetical protein